MTLYHAAGWQHKNTSKQHNPLTAQQSVPACQPTCVTCMVIKCTGNHYLFATSPAVGRAAGSLIKMKPSKSTTAGMCSTGCNLSGDNNTYSMPVTSGWTRSGFMPYCVLQLCALPALLLKQLRPCTLNISADSCRIRSWAHAAGCCKCLDHAAMHIKFCSNGVLQWALIGIIPQSSSLPYRASVHTPRVEAGCDAAQPEVS